jgi:hypothetical protein
MAATVSACPCGDSSRQFCDLCAGQPPVEVWAIEVKMLRLMGDDGVSPKTPLQLRWRIGYEERSEPAPALPLKERLRPLRVTCPGSRTSTGRATDGLGLVIVVVRSRSSQRWAT